MASLNPMSWFRGRREQRSSSLGGGYVPAAPVLSGTYVTPQTALGLTAVFASINVISRDIATLPWSCYKLVAGGGREVDAGKRVHSLLAAAPNDEIDAFSFWQTMTAHVLGYGNAYAEIVRDPRTGEPVELHVLHPSKTVPKRTEAKVLFYELENKRRLLAEDVLHFSGLGFDGLVGYSPITVARQTIGLAIGAEQYGASWFGNAAVPKGVLSHPKRLSEAAANNLRRAWNQIHQGSQSSHQVAVLEEGMSWVSTQINPEDGQWLGTREFQVKDIARLYSIPPHKIGDYSESHLANVEEANSDYKTTTLAGWVASFRAQANFKLLTAADRSRWLIDAELDELDRGNTQARMLKAQTMRNTGAWSADDIRRYERMNPIGSEKGGDLYLVQGQYVPLSQVGKTPLIPPKPEAKSIETIHINGHRFHLHADSDD